MRSEPQDVGLAFDVLTPNCRVWLDLATLVLKQVLLNELTQTKLVSWWHVPLHDCTCHHLTIPAKNWNFWEKWAIWNKYKLRAIKNDAFFILEQRNIYTRGYMSLRRDI